jgi:hypothetical protein
MNKLVHPMKRLATIIVLCCTVLLFGVFALPAHAETTAKALPLNMTVSLSPVSQTAHVNQSASITLSWAGGGTGTTVFIMDWRDGSSDSYRCIFACTTGTVVFSHTYTRTGTFIAKGYLDSNSAIAGWSTVKVI